MAANPAAEAIVSEAEKDVARQRDDYHERMKGKPTPTQHECNLIKAGSPPDTKEPTGAGKEVVYGMRQMEASPGGGAGYQTRTVRGAPASRAPAE